MTQDSLFALLEAVQDEPSFLRFTEALATDRRACEKLELSLDGHRGEWANHSIEDFLLSAKAWAEDSHFGERPGPKPSNVWQLFAAFLWAGRGYE